MLGERLRALLRDLEKLTLQDQQRLADQIETWIANLEWQRLLNEEGPNALYEATLDEMRRSETRPLRLKELVEEA